MTIAIIERGRCPGALGALGGAGAHIRPPHVHT
jgi:hypothetical protein